MKKLLLTSIILIGCGEETIPKEEFNKHKQSLVESYIHLTGRPVIFDIEYTDKQRVQLAVGNNGTVRYDLVEGHLAECEVLTGYNSSWEPAAWVNVWVDAEVYTQLSNRPIFRDGLLFKEMAFCDAWNRQNVNDMVKTNYNREIPHLLHEKLRDYTDFTFMENDFRNQLKSAIESIATD